MANKFTNGFSISALIISVISLTFSAVTFYSNRENKRADIFVNLHSRYLEIANNLPDKHIEISSLKKYSTDWQHYKEYWYHSFTEWYVTKTLSPSGAEDLWSSYFKDAQKSALQIPVYKKVACELMVHEFLIMESRRKYVKVLADLMEENKDKDGCKTFATDTSNNIVKSLLSR